MAKVKAAQAKTGGAVQDALASTDAKYLAKLIQMRQPAKTGCTFKEQQSVDRLAAAKWTLVNETLPGLSPNMKAYTSDEIQGYRGFVSLDALHPCMVLVAGARFPQVRGNFRALGPTAILLEVEEGKDPVVYDVIPGGYVLEKTGDMPDGAQATCAEFKKAGFSHALVQPRE